VKFAFIHVEKAHHPVKSLCRLLEVTRQGYYAYAKRPPSPRVECDARLQVRVREAFDDNRGCYGSPRIFQQFLREGLPVSKRRVERAMRSQGLYARQPRRWRATTCSNPADEVAPNTLARDFTSTRPNERWVTDITYIWTAAGWCYLSAILDLFSRRVVGWALGANLSTQLPLKALEMATRRRRPEVGLLHHSDRGCQYTSYEYRQALAKRGIEVSMSRRGNCWDNAVAESFFATIKTELVHRRSWSSMLEVRQGVSEYIETFYNRNRLHSSLAYRTPTEVEEQYAAQAA
jgi:putative transposase